MAKRSCSKMRSIARSRSGRSGWPSRVTWSRQAGWVSRSVAIAPRARSAGSNLCREAGARRRLGVIGHEEGGSEGFARIDPVAVEIGDALGRQERVVDQKDAGKVFRRLCAKEARRARQDEWGG